MSGNDNPKCESCGVALDEHDGLTLCCEKLIQQQRLIDQLTTALRELYDFSERNYHYRHAERSKEAFKAAVKLLRKIGK